MHFDEHAATKVNGCGPHCRCEENQRQDCEKTGQEISLSSTH